MVAHGPDGYSRDRSDALRSVLAVALVANLTVAIAKGFYGELTGSAGMGADGLHSALDAGGSLIGLIGITLATRPADPGHPYGYSRYESLASLAVGGLLVVALIRIVGGAVARLLDPEPVQVTWISFAVMALSLVFSSGLFWWERRRSLALGSELLHADATHTASDALVSVGVMGGLLAAILGFPILDTLVALGVAVVLSRAAWSVIKTATRALTDAAVVDLEGITSLALQVPGVLDCHAVRARGSPGQVRVDLHVLVDAAMRVDEAHEVSEEVSLTVKDRVSGVVEVLVHVGPAGVHHEPQ